MHRHEEVRADVHAPAGDLIGFDWGGCAAGVFQGTEIEVHVCKLLIILDYLNGKVPESTILKLIKVTFKTMIEAFKACDSILLRHIVEFFLDVLKQGSQAEIIASYQHYNAEVEKLLEVSVKMILFHGVYNSENSSLKEN